MASLNVTDHRSNAPEHIERAVEVIGRSERRRKVFEAVYRGKPQIKTVNEIVSSTGLSKKDVLTAGRKLAGNSIVHQVKLNKETAYQKDDFYATNRDKILRLLVNPAALEKLATKRRPQTSSQVEVLTFPKEAIQIKELTLDDIDSFASAPKKFARTIDLRTIPENRFKAGIQEIIGEPGTFTDWGGETSDLLTTRVVYKGKRIRTAFAFKGPGTKGKLTPGKMGKNGDQIQRLLFDNSADLYILQYWYEINQSVSEQMEAFAKLKSIAERKMIFFCIIDGEDTQRLVEAYPDLFT